MITAGPAGRVAGLLAVVATFAVSPAARASKWLDPGSEPPRVDSNADDPATELAEGGDAGDLFAKRRWAFEGHVGVGTLVGAAARRCVQELPEPTTGNESMTESSGSEQAAGEELRVCL